MQKYFIKFYYADGQILPVKWRNGEKQDTKKIEFQHTLYFVQFLKNHAYFTYNRFVSL